MNLIWHRNEQYTAPNWSTNHDHNVKDFKGHAIGHHLVISQTGDGGTYKLFTRTTRSDRDTKTSLTDHGHFDTFNEADEAAKRFLRKSNTDLKRYHRSTK